MSMNKSKKIISILAATTLALSTVSLAACGTQKYKGETLSAGYVSAAEVTSNGGFVVEKGEYVYFINGKEENTADNTYGEVVKGALMRISKTDLAAGEYSKAQIVVPSLFVTGNYDSGIYIYGDYVYYATPTTDRNNAGEVANTSLDFKRAKIDGTEAPMGGKDEYFFRLSSNTTKYRYVEENNVVYCLYEQDSALKSYNTSTGKTTVLVKGADTIYYDTEDLTNPNVYYTMGVTLGLDEENPSAQDYNQIYTVNAAATYAVDASKAAYTAKDEKGEVVASYDFKEEFFNKENAEAKANKEDEPYDLSDYTTYPYVNLGKLVLDGIGSTNEYPVYRKGELADKSQAIEPFGYTYTVQGYQNGGVYFTRKATDRSLTYLYYLEDSKDDAADWNEVTGNALTEVSKDTAKASASALYTFDGTAHSFFYLSGSNACYVKGGDEVSIPLGVESATLWKVDGNYLYFYASGTNGKSVNRVNYTGTQTDYNWKFDEEYDVVTLPLVDFHDSWYKPEFVTAGGKTLLLYANAQSFGSGGVSYNNIYAATVGTNAEIKAANEKIEAINDEIAEHSSDLQNLMTYYFRTAETAKYEEVKDLYSTEQKNNFTGFVDWFATNGAFEKTYIQALGRVNEEDSESMSEDWTNYLKTETVEETDDSLPDWAIWLIVVGSILVVGGAAVVVTLVVRNKKKAKKEREEAIVNAYKRKKIDTTDDKSIDVYADEPEEVAAEPAAETTVEEGAETTEEAQAPADEN